MDLLLVMAVHLLDAIGEWNATRKRVQRVVFMMSIPLLAFTWLQACLAFVGLIGKLLKLINLLLIHLALLGSLDIQFTFFLLLMMVVG